MTLSPFLSLASDLEIFLDRVVRDDSLHLIWLNALSYLENCGARKIASTEHPTRVKKEMLKHAYEEFRHAYILKQQLAKLDASFPIDYTPLLLLGKMKTLHYLNRLNLLICRYLGAVAPNQLKEVAYLLVTYAVEKRAQELYPIYQICLKRVNSKITVRSIITDEEEHLAAMEEELSYFSNGRKWMDSALDIEGKLCNDWLGACLKSI